MKLTNDEETRLIAEIKRRDAASIGRTRREQFMGAVYACKLDDKLPPPTSWSAEASNYAFKAGLPRIGFSNRLPGEEDNPGKPISISTLLEQKNRLATLIYWRRRLKIDVALAVNQKDMAERLIKMHMEDIAHLDCLIEASHKY